MSLHGRQGAAPAFAHGAGDHADGPRAPAPADSGASVTTWKSLLALIYSARRCFSASSQPVRGRGRGAGAGRTHNPLWRPRSATDCRGALRQRGHATGGGAIAWARTCGAQSFGASRDAQLPDGQAAQRLACWVACHSSVCARGCAGIPISDLGRFVLPMRARQNTAERESSSRLAKRRRFVSQSRFAAAASARAGERLWWTR